jgi:hypothetical protein
MWEVNKDFLKFGAAAAGGVLIAHASIKAVKWTYGKVSGMFEDNEAPKDKKKEEAK